MVEKNSIKNNNKIDRNDNKKVTWIDCKIKWCEEVGRKINKWW